MAYNWTAETKLTNQSGHPREWLVRLYEYEAATASEWAIGDDADDDDPKHGDPCPFETCRLVSYRAQRITGTSATVDPAMGKASGLAGLDHIWTNGAVGALIEQQPGVIVRLKDTGRVIFGKSGIDAGTDSVIHTEFILIEGSA